MTFQTWRSIGTSAVAIVGVGAMFGLACYSLYLNRTATAGVAATMTLALVLIRQLHVMESFEILSLKAKFTNRVSEAEALLAHIRQSAAASAKVSYVQLAYMNRMGDIGWLRKRDLLEGLDRTLTDMNLPSGEIVSMKVPFLNIISFDLAVFFQNSVRELVRPRLNDMQDRFNEHLKTARFADDPVSEQFRAEISRLQVMSIEWRDVLGDRRLRELRKTLGDWVAATALDGDDLMIAGKILGEVASLSEQCWGAGTITNETEAYLNRYRDDTRLRVSELRSEANGE